MKAEGIILAVTAAETAECAGLGLPLGRLSYRVSPAGVLLRSTALGDARGGVMILMGRIPENADPAALSAAILTECRLREYTGVVLDGGGAGAALAAALCPQLDTEGKTLYAPAEWGIGTAICDSAVTGGSFALYLEEIAARHGAFAIELRPLALRYVLPADGTGEELTRAELEEICSAGYLQYYSGELVARYLTYRGEDGLTRFVLYDDAASLREKCRMAREAGAAAILLPYGLLREELADILEI